MSQKPTMNDPEKSDGLVVPMKSPNNAGPVPAAEAVEGRSPAKGNTDEQNAPRTQRRISASNALERVRQAAGRFAASTQGRSRVR
jgi:hypothetical protein